MSEQGFIKLSRKYFKSFMWKESRAYSRAEAWLDLIFQARFETSTELINGRVIEVMRGEIPASRRFLEERWKWGSSKVSNFIDILVKQEMINQRIDQGQTVYMLCKYDTYNDSQTSDEPRNEPATNAETNHVEIKTDMKSNQLHDQKQTTEPLCDSASCDETQTSDEPANKPATNQRQTSDEPATNQSKEYKKERIKEDNNNSPLVPQSDDSSNLTVDEIIQSKKGKEKSSAKKENSPLQFPYDSEAFMTAWNQLIASPKWKKKIPYTLQLALNKLAKYEESFCVQQMELAAMNNWQGLIFPDTDDKYRKWTLSKNGLGLAQPQKISKTQQMLLDAQNLMQDG